MSDVIRTRPGGLFPCSPPPGCALHAGALAPSSSALGVDDPLFASDGLPRLEDDTLIRGREHATQRVEITELHGSARVCRRHAVATWRRDRDHTRREQAENAGGDQNAWRDTAPSDAP